MTEAVENVFAAIGRWLIGGIRSAGAITLLFLNILRCMVKYPIRWRLFLQQMYFIGVKSQVVVLTTGAFVGAVFAAQIHFQFIKFGMQSAVGATVSVAMCRELGPVFCCLLLAGRVGAAMAAEISSMKNTEQIDALRAMGVYPVEYLGVPRFLAMLVSTPVLTGLVLIVGIACGYLVAVPILGVDSAYYWDNTIKYTAVSDVLIGLTKGFLFSMIIAVISCYKGFNPELGTAGVGRTTTEAVVISSLAILISDFFFTFILNSLFLGGA
ncbi:MAG: ABC transporter permease [Verrucomicrobiales bacterium]|jgi:phospholipid/cholesterol/gamma-HCH transport system permease protein|nr:ABC transporter permease [Verrucomicrobiales bacterium]